MFGHWGFERLAAREREASIDEMKHAESLIERILFLEGLPNLQSLHKLLIGEDVAEALGCDLKLELAAHPVLKTAIADCEACGDYVSRDLFRQIMARRRSTSTGWKRSSSSSTRWASRTTSSRRWADGD